MGKRNKRMKIKTRNLKSSTQSDFGPIFPDFTI